MCYACLLVTGRSADLLQEHHGALRVHAPVAEGPVAAGGAARFGPSGPIPAAALIANDLARFSRNTVLADGRLTLDLHTTAGPAQVGGGPFGSQTITTLAMGADLQAFLRDSVARLDRLLAIDFAWSGNALSADVNLYLDREIANDGADRVLGLAVTNSQAGRQWWEVFVDGTELAGQGDYLRYAYLHELGHVLGLEHPFDGADGDVFVSAEYQLSAFPEDTVMAYRFPLGGRWPTWFSDNDIEAMVRLWGAELQQYGDGDDQVVGGNYSEKIAGAGGNDVIAGRAGHDSLFGGQGDDLLLGGPGADWLFGSAGNDTLRGGAGHDQLRGGLGDDELWGGRGADVFGLSPGNDRVMDFRTSDGDRLGLPVGLGYSLAQSNNDLLVQTELGVTTLLNVSLAGFNPAEQIVPFG